MRSILAKKKGQIGLTDAPQVVMIVGFITMTIFVGAAIGTMFGIGLALRFMVGYYVDWNNIFLAAINWLWW